LAYAALYGHFDIFHLKGVRLDVTKPAMRDVARYACKGEGLRLVEVLLEKGLNAND
jgi:hypothetical protein